MSFIHYNRSHCHVVGNSAAAASVQTACRIVEHVVDVVNSNDFTVQWCSLLCRVKYTAVLLYSGVYCAVQCSVQH